MIVGIGMLVRTRSMEPRDTRAVRALLPELVMHDDLKRVVVVVPGGSSQIIGAAAYRQEIIQTRPSCVPFTMTIAAPFRKRGFGRMLLRAAADDAHESLNVPGLCNWFGVERGSPLAGLAKKFGFERRPKLAHYNADIRTYLDLLSMTLARMETHGRIPKSARVIPLSKSSIGEIIDLHIRYLGGRSARLERRLRGTGIRPFDPELSQVAMFGDEVAGFTLARINHEGKAVIDSRVISPKYRQKWVNPLMLVAAGRAAERRGLSVVRFAGATEHVDTHRMGTRLGNPAIRIMDVYIYEHPCNTLRKNNESAMEGSHEQSIAESSSQ